MKKVNVIFSVCVLLLRNIRIKVLSYTNFKIFDLFGTALEKFNIKNIDTFYYKKLDFFYFKINY